MKFGTKRAWAATKKETAYPTHVLLSTCSQAAPKVIADFKKVQKRKGSKFTQTKRFLTNQKTNKLREIEIDGMHVEILPPEGKVKEI